jgi:hypothetical protein
LSKREGSGAQYGFPLLPDETAMTICTRCSASFECGMVERPDLPCWCVALPPLSLEALPAPEQPSCLCPGCLQEWIASREPGK